MPLGVSKGLGAVVGAHWRKAGVACALVLLVACAGSSPGTTSQPSTASTAVGSGVDRFDTFTLITPSEILPESGGAHRAFIEEAVTIAVVNEYRFTEASALFHKEVFADGEVTRAEYERSKFASADCLRELGHTVLGPIEFGPDTGRLVFVGGDPRDYLHWLIVEPGDTASDDGMLCQELWDFTVSHVWLSIHTPTELERQLWLTAAWDCARDKDLPLSDPPTEREAADAVAFGCEPWHALPPR